MNAEEREALEQLDADAAVWLEARASGRGLPRAAASLDASMREAKRLKNRRERHERKAAKRERSA